MDGSGGQKSGKLKVVQGGKYPYRGRRRGPRGRTVEELDLDRRMHTAVTRITDPSGNVPDRRTYRVRELTGWPWRVMGRMIVGWFRRDVPRDQVKLFMREFDGWVDDVYDGKIDRPRAA